MIGIEPGEVRLRDLLVMADARRDGDWNRTASLMAQVANVGLKPRKPFRPSDFHPFNRRPRPSIADSIREIGPLDASKYLPVSLKVTPEPTKEPTP